MVYGKWEIKTKYRDKNHTMCECRCTSCGAERTIRGDILKKKPPHCRCMPIIRNDYVGRKIGYLDVVERIDDEKYLCECVCGNAIIVSKDDLRSRTIMSCGCMKGGKGLYPHTCRECGNAFEGGPRAWYCPDCRKIRRRESDRKSAERQKIGLSVKLGSKMTCEMCGKECIRNSANQRLCSDCSKINLLTVDRQQAIEYYHKNKDIINPKRNEFRKIK